VASQHIEAIVLISLHIAIVAGVGIRVGLGCHAPGSFLYQSQVTSRYLARPRAGQLIDQHDLGAERPHHARPLG